jgi:hypothetical protein
MPIIKERREAQKFKASLIELKSVIGGQVFLNHYRLKRVI